MFVIFGKDLKKSEDENRDQYIWRLCFAKDTGELEYSWDELAEILNKNLYNDECEYLGASAFRKRYQYAKAIYDNVFSKMESENFIEEYEEKKRELAKLKVQYRDERNEYNKLIREEARKESYADYIKRMISENVDISYEYNEKDYINGDNDLIIHLTDLHDGIDIDNFFNKYNENILEDRLGKYLGNIESIAKTHNSQECYVIIGEVLSGLIHSNLRCENNQNLIEQFLHASSCISKFLFELSNMFNKVHVYVTPGNHSRVSPKKEDSLKGENFDNLLIPFLSAKLQNISNIAFYTNDIEESIAMFSVRGNKIFSSHGDKDAPNNVVQKFTLLFGMIPDIVYLGHRHRNAMSTVYNTKVIESGCVSGADNYALNLRLKTSPEQTVSVINEKGLVCLYDIQLV